ncbi:phosphate regulon sensor histidine kinase PhoR [Aliikangiella marina]|uniref:Phosphate regulon sensor protein PhoR n=1 Tax=Aliikangiella marina TaxID=1712262 RepID=A0A545TBN3_9GAMM|nr:phosphate regulon sensor histidine kinase PhoR [Aliikangiella marina]TQV74614.1 phosphate regulon sensor histidine kinase PhoR [Aliikangiella marina]
MNNAWTIEFTRIVVVVAIAILFGLVSGYWMLAILVPFSVYVGWMLTQIRVLERWIRLGAKNSLAPDSNGIWQLIVQHIVHAQRKNTERKVRLSQMANRFEAIIAALPEATVVINANREIELTNQASFTLLGIDKQRDLGQKIDNLIRDPAFHALIESPEQNTQVEIESPIDNLKTLSMNCVDFGSDQKLITARDVSQRIAVQKLRKAFIANASHELRTPLTVIAGYLELLESEVDIPEHIRRQITNASHQASRMQKILDDLLMLSKLEEKGYNKRSGVVVDMASLVEKLVADFRKTRAKGTHEIIMNVDHSLQVKAVESELYSLCQNLLSNAVKYSPKGSVIHVKWEKAPEGSPVFTVTDNGEGIAPEYISRLTERFFRVNVNRSRQIGGTGLGLSIVKHILENLGGYLNVESELGRGSEFSAYFPRYRAIDESQVAQNVQVLKPQEEGFREIS